MGAVDLSTLAVAATATLGYQGLIAPGIHWARLPLPYTREDHINVWLLEDGRAGNTKLYTLVDTGQDDAPTRALWPDILAALPGPARIRRLVVTHHHPDHLALAAWFEREHGCEVLMPAAEIAEATELLRAADDTTETQQAAAFAAFYGSHGMAEQEDDAWRRFYRGLVSALPHIAPLADGDSIDIGGTRWQARLAGGHSPAHLLLHAPALGVLISGDHILPEIVTNIAMPAVDDGGNPLAAYLESLTRAATLPADTQVLPAHGLPFTGLPARCVELADIHRQRRDATLRACDTPRSLNELLPVLYGRALSALGGRLAFNQTRAYLASLEAQGAVVCDRGSDGSIRYQARTS